MAKKDTSIDNYGMKSSDTINAFCPKVRFILFSTSLHISYAIPGKVLQHLDVNLPTSPNISETSDPIYMLTSLVCNSGEMFTSPLTSPHTID